MITRFWGRAIGPVPLLSICLLVIAGCSGDNKMEDPAGPGGSKTIYTWMDVQSEAGGTQLVLTYGGSLVSDAACGSEFSSEGWFQGGETTICMERANDVTFLVTEVGADYIRGNLNLNGKVWFNVGYWRHDRSAFEKNGIILEDANGTLLINWPGAANVTNIRMRLVQ